MEKHFVCLANSYKHGGRCIAGVEVTLGADGAFTIVKKDDGSPRWIRPITHSENEAIPNDIAAEIGIFSLVELTDVVPCPNKAHSENVYFGQMKRCPSNLRCDKETLDQFIDTAHQTAFYFRGKAIPASMIDRLNYSLMLIHPQDVHAYVDEEREKSKYRMKFTYYGSHYDFPITDPVFLEAFKKDPQSFSEPKDAYLTVSLGMEFEGFHFKLVATVFTQTYVTEPTTHVTEPTNWFETYEHDLERLINLKKDVEQQISALRKELISQMESRSLDEVSSNKFTISYTPPTTIMRFDRQAFQAENEALYKKYCKPTEKAASIVVRNNSNI